MRGQPCLSAPLLTDGVVITYRDALRRIIPEFIS